MKTKKMNLLLKLVIAILVIGVGKYCVSYEKYDISIGRQDVQQFNQHWIHYENGQEIEVELPCRLNITNEKQYSIYNVVPSDIKDDMVLSFESSHQFVKVKVDGEVIYDQDQFQDYVTSGSYILTIPLKSSYANKTIEMEFTKNQTLFLGVVDEMIYGYRGDVRYHLLDKSKVRILVALLLLSMGSVGIIFLLFARNTMRQTELGYRILYISSAAALFALWMIGETKVIQLVIGNYVIVTQMVYIALMLIPIPVIMYGKLIGQFHNDRVFDVLYCLNMISLIVCCILVILRVVVFIQLLPWIQFLIFTTGVVTLGYMWYEVIRYNNSNAAYMVKIGGIILLIYSAEILQFYIRKLNKGATFTSLIALVLFVVIAIHAYEWVPKLVIRNKEVSTYKKIAYMDGLTNAYNRAAYELLLEAYFKKPYFSYRLAMFDLDRLKYVNDTYGHIIGDEFIRFVSENLIESFGPIGHVFRIGGDEFAVVLCGRDIHSYDKAKERFDAKVQEFSMKCQYPVSIACGYSDHDSQDKSPNDIVERADASMYKNKNEQRDTNI